MISSKTCARRRPWERKGGHVTIEQKFLVGADLFMGPRTCALRIYSFSCLTSRCIISVDILSEF